VATAGESGVGSLAQEAGTHVSPALLDGNGELLKTPVALLTALPFMDHITGMQLKPGSNNGATRFMRVSPVATSLKQAPSIFQVFSPLQEKPGCHLPCTVPRAATPGVHALPFTLSLKNCPNEFVKQYTAASPVAGTARSANTTEDLSIVFICISVMGVSDPEFTVAF
jgi:hypothetical protein